MMIIVAVDVLNIIHLCWRWSHSASTVNFDGIVYIYINVMFTSLVF